MTSATLSGDETLVLPEFDAPPADPFALLARWLADADERGVREPRAAVLATTDGRTVSSRTILVKDVDDGRVVFGSHTGSRKGRDLRRVPHASLTLYWRETMQQVHLSGPVEELSPTASDALFAARTREARAAAVVSRQSAGLDDEDALRAAVDDLLATSDEIDRPDGWSGFAMRPDHVELWHGRSDRMHRRLAYTHGVDGWTARRLQP